MPVIFLFFFFFFFFLHFRRNKEWLKIIPWGVGGGVGRGEKYIEGLN
jgi:hypothetical protein